MRLWALIPEIGPTLLSAVILWMLVYLASRVIEHSILLYASRTGSDGIGADGSEDSLSYRVVLQNNESAPLRARLRLTVLIENDEGAFLGLPRLYAGPSAVRLIKGRGNRVVSLEFQELPAYDTWVLVWQTNRAARDIAVRLVEVDRTGKPVRRLLMPLSRPSVRLTFPTTKVVAGGGRTPGWLLGLCALSVAIALYLFPLLTQNPWVPLRGLFSPFERSLDWGLLLGISAGSGVLWWASRRSGPPVVQGYWLASRLLRDEPGTSEDRSSMVNE